MIRFRCHRCKRPIAVPDKKFVGKKVKCPGCSIVTIVPDIPGAQVAKAKAQAAVKEQAAVMESDFEETPLASDPLSQLANAAETYDVAFDDPTDSPRQRRAEREERRPRRRGGKGGGGPFMFFGAVIFVAGITGAAATHLKEPQEMALFFSLSGAGILAGLVLFFVGVAKS